MLPSKREDAMGRAEQLLSAASTTDLEFERLGAAREPDAVIDAVRAYLGSWSTERVERLQRADAGWAPFDQFQRPLTMTCPDDVDDFHRDLHRHCSALRASGHELPAELHELDLFLLLAHALLQVTRQDGAGRKLRSVS
jgi:hypothetical protein